MTGDTVSHVDIFDPALWTIAHLNFSLIQEPPRTVYTECGAGRGGGGEGAELCCYVGDHNLQEFNTLLLTRFRTYKIAFPPPNKNLGGERVAPDR